MASYLTLYKFNGSVKGGGPERFEKFKGLVEAEGGTMLRFHGLLGEFDVMTLCDFPSNRAALKAAAAVGNLINARPRTLPALEEADFLQLLTELG